MRRHAAHPPRAPRSLAVHPWAWILSAVLLAGGALADTPDEWAVSALTEGRVVASEDLGVGVTFPLLLTIEHEGRRVRALFKDVDLAVPHRGEGPDPHMADRWRHEVAAYRVDRLIGLGLVPLTVSRRHGGRQGSLQIWIENASSLGELDRKEPPSLREKRRLFDALIFNPDRNPGNTLLAGDDGHPWLVDHSRAFRALPRIPASLGFDPVTVPPELAGALRGLDRATLDRELGELLAPEQIETILVRRDLILEQAP